jgi:hypothetical protein
LKSVSTACAGTADVPFCVAGAEIACFVRRHLALSGVMLAGPAGLATGSMQACHGAIYDGEGLVHQWRVTRLKRLGIPGPLAQAEADRVGWRQIAGTGPAQRFARGQASFAALGRRARSRAR